MTPAPPDAAPPRCARPSATLLCLGNPLLGDDGLGEALLDRLRERFVVPPSLEAVAGGNGALDLLPVVEDAEQLLVVDAIDAGRASGSLVILEADEIPLALGRAVSPHQVGIAQVLALATVRDRLPVRLAAMGLQPGPPREGIGLSPAVERRLPDLLESVVARLALWGLPLEEAAAAPSAQRVWSWNVAR